MHKGKAVVCLIKIVQNYMRTQFFITVSTFDQEYIQLPKENPEIFSIFMEKSYVQF